MVISSSEARILTISGMSMRRMAPVLVSMKALVVKKGGPETERNLVPTGVTDCHRGCDGESARST